VIRVIQKNKKTVISAVLLAAGIALVTAGLLQGGYRDVLNKAVQICMECIGIG
jgi:hypothetical protein